MIQPIDISQLKFYLVFNETGARYEIDAPNGFFNDFKLTIKQRKRYARELSFGDKIKLKFNNEVGNLGHRFTELLSEYEAKSWEADVDMEVYYGLDLWFTTELEFETTVTDKREYLEVDSDVKSLRKVIEQLKDNKVDILSEETLDGTPLLPISTNNVLLQPKEILDRGVHNLSDEDGNEVAEINFTKNALSDNITRFYTYGLVTSSIDESNGYVYWDANDEPVGVTGTQDSPVSAPDTLEDGVQPLDGVLFFVTNNNVYNYKFELENKVNIRADGLSLSYTVDGVPLSEDLRFVIRLLVIEWDEGFENRQNAYYINLVDETGNFNDLSFNIDLDITTYTTLTYEIAAKYDVSAIVGTTLINYKFKNSEYILDAVDIFPATSAKMIPLGRVGSRLVDIYTNTQAIFRMPLFGIGNAGTGISPILSEYRATTGSYIRGFDDFGMPLDYKTFEEQAQTAFNMDIQINGRNVYVGRQDEFYTDIEVARIEYRPDIDSFEVKPNKKRIINKFTQSFKKYEDDDKQNTIDAIHTESEWLILNKKIKGEQSNEAPMNSDGFSIENIRREGVLREPTTAKKEDNDWYMIDTISNIDGNISVNPFKNRTNQGFDFIANVFSPKTAYNLLCTPKRLIHDHWLHYIAECAQNLNNGNPAPETKVFQNQFFVANGEATTQASASLDKTTPIRITENKDLTWGDLKTPFITGFIYEFTLAKRFKFSELKALYDGIIDKKGFVSLYQDSVEIKVYPTLLEYDLSKEELKIVGEQKWN